ncbi:hypothetical protein [Brevundimonas sp. DC300-4]|uniref:hypothetical protein n=1 Tax=Brevundimonas sp. DC300-4 TaxID=2804594 RepID=UPI003CEC2464
MLAEARDHTGATAIACRALANVYHTRAVHLSALVQSLPPGKGVCCMSVYDPETMTPRAHKSSAHTAVAAAIDAGKTAPTMIDRIWEIYLTGPHTPEEVHEKLSSEGRILLTSVRARICGLHKAGRLIASGEKGLGESRRSKVIRWKIASPTQMSEAIAKRVAAT